MSPASTPTTTSIDGAVKTWPLNLLRIEGATIFACTLWAYAKTGRSWWTFAAALLLPDMAMSGYFFNTMAGAASYNVFHWETPPLLLLCTGYARQSSNATAVGLVWLAHIGMDRMLGFGLKYGQGFGHTHLGFIGKRE